MKPSPDPTITPRHRRRRSRPTGRSAARRSSRRCGALPGRWWPGHTAERSAITRSRTSTRRPGRRPWGPASARSGDGRQRASGLSADGGCEPCDKEMRRRSRKPAAPFEAEKEHVVTDRHQPSPEEIVIGSEARGVARDLLTSLPPRRRAVMLLRYGWGLSPNEVCALVEGLSPRAYRKEVTRGVEQLIGSLRSVESGEWCESREPLIRDLVAGTADESTRRQAQQHLDHCRACSDLAARLSGHLHEMGGWSPSPRSPASSAGS